jgi:hypothetical protein
MNDEQKGGTITVKIEEWASDDRIEQIKRYKSNLKFENDYNCIGEFCYTMCRCYTFLMMFVLLGILIIYTMTISELVEDMRDPIVVLWELIWGAFDINKTYQVEGPNSKISPGNRNQCIVFGTSTCVGGKLDPRFNNIQV